MKERIIQLSDSEYNLLYEKANATKDEIRSMAERYYQERGVYKIDVKLGFDEKYNGDTTYYVTSFSTENGLYKDNGFKPILTEKGRQKINKIIKGLCEHAFVNEFGDVIEVRNMYAEGLKKLTYLKWILYGIAFSGWGVATALLLFH